MCVCVCVCLHCIIIVWIFQDRCSHDGDAVSLVSCPHLPVVPTSTGDLVSLEAASNILSAAEASKNMQQVGELLTAWTASCFLLTVCD